MRVRVRGSRQGQWSGPVVRARVRVKDWARLRIGLEGGGSAELRNCGGRFATISCTALRSQWSDLLTATPGGGQYVRKREW